MLNLLTTELKSYKKLVNPDKFYIGNSNIMQALGSPCDIGTIRETFLRIRSEPGILFNIRRRGISSLVENTFSRSGGAGKTFDQIKDEPDSYLAVDDTEIGSGARIPLWMFGFLY